MAEIVAGGPRLLIGAVNDVTVAVGNSGDYSSVDAPMSMGNLGPGPFATLRTLSLLQPLVPVVPHQLARVRGTDGTVPTGHIIRRAQLLASPADSVGILGMKWEFRHSRFLLAATATCPTSIIVLSPTASSDQGHCPTLQRIRPGVRHAAAGRRPTASSSVLTSAASSLREVARQMVRLRGAAADEQYLELFRSNRYFPSL